MRATVDYVLLKSRKVRRGPARVPWTDEPEAPKRLPIPTACHRACARWPQVFLAAWTLRRMSSFARGHGVGRSDRPGIHTTSSGGGGF